MNDGGGDASGKGADDPPFAVAPTPLRVFLAFAKIGLMSFGGGLTGWYLREFVHRLRWLSEAEFVTGLSLAQALPGVNVANMAIFIGHRVCGLKGSIAGLAGIVAPAAFAVIGIASIFDWLSRFPATHFALIGAAAASIGFGFVMTVTAALHVPRRMRPLAFMAATFVAVAIMQWPLIWVTLAAGAANVALEYFDTGSA